MQLACGKHTLDLRHAQVMGILNVTPDSFSDGGRLYQGDRLSVDAALIHAAQMVDEGASLIDIGGESTRPGAAPVSEQQELDRVLPVLERIVTELDVIVSVDTSRAQVIKEAARLGAGMINDVRALQHEGALAAAAAAGLPVCLMHMQGEPQTMQQAPHYQHLLEEINAFFAKRIQACQAAGIPRQQLLLDPGFGFGKTLEHNLLLLNRLDQLTLSGLPLLVGMSRKRMLAEIVNRPVDQRLAAGLVTVVMAVQKGAKIIRVHDVAASVDAVRMTEAVMAEQKVSYD